MHYDDQRFERRRFLQRILAASVVTGLGAAALRSAHGQEELEDGEYPLEVAEFIDMQGQARAAAEISDRLPDGWSKSPTDPAGLVPAFSRLGLRDGMTLRAYLFHEGGNGNGIVWAMASDAEYPEADECPVVTTHVRRPPKPVDALDDFMEIIEGDESAASFFEASLLGRELLEFGASWHGVSWRTHLLLGADPWKQPPTQESEPFAWRRTAKRQWTWKEEQPERWEPTVTVDGDRIQVTFYTYSGYQKERLYRFVDTYRKGSYRFTSSRTVLAEGRPGFVF